MYIGLVFICIGISIHSRTFRLFFKMKAFFGYLLLVCFLARNAEAFSATEKAEISRQVMSAGVGCIKDNPLTLSDFKAFKMHTIPDEGNAKCFVACMFKNVGIMDDKGMLSPAGARANAAQVFNGNEEYLKNVDAIMEKCSKVNEEQTTDGYNGCDRAKLIHTCLTENASNYGFDFDF